MMLASATARNAAVLIWVPVLLARPVIDALTGADPLVSLMLAIVAAVAGASAVLYSWPHPTPRAVASWAVLAVVVIAASLLWATWAPTWLLVAMVAGVCLPTPAVLMTVPGAAIASMLIMARHNGFDDDVAGQGFVVLLAGTTAAVLSRLVATTRELQRSRSQLAEVAVAQERERVARDLHDVLGHTLSVMVVKAAAARRLAHTDPDAAAGHAADIESIGRSALTDVRATIRRAQPLTIDQELSNARDALDAAGIRAVLPAVPAPPRPADEPLAWALREGVTNVLRHSHARSCEIALACDAQARRLTISDDGVGARPGSLSGGGLDGLRRRLEAAGGGLTTDRQGNGFTLTAWIPA